MKISAKRSPEVDKSLCIYYNSTMDNLILIGMPSAGKSTAGVLLAKRIGFGFVDCDLMIQGEEKHLLSDLIDAKGSEGYLEIENRVCSGLFVSRCVVATGGSVCYCEEAMEHLRSLGTIIYLEISAEEAERRLTNLKRRGVVMRSGIKTIKELHRERVPLYEKYADIVVDCNGLTIDETVETLAAAAGFRQQ